MMDSVQTLFHDFRYAVRQLVNHPAFSITALLSLGLGIGATTAVFSVVYAALMNPYPYSEAGRILRLRVQNQAGEGRGVSLNSPQIQQLRQSTAVEDLIAMDEWSLTMTGHDVPEDVEAIYLTSNGFNFLGVPPLLGRGLLPADASTGRIPNRWLC